MSSKSWGLASSADDLLVDNSDILDYEPDGLEDHAELNFDLRVKNTSTPHAKQLPSIENLRSIYREKNIFLKEGNKTFRSGFPMQYLPPNESLFLDSSDDEIDRDGLHFSEDDYEIQFNDANATSSLLSNQCNKKTFDNDSINYDNMMPSINSQSSITPTSSCKDVATNMQSSKPKNKTPSLGFTIKVVNDGGNRHVFTNVRFKRPWTSCIKKYMKKHIFLRSTDPIIKYIPPDTESDEEPGATATKNLSVFKTPLKPVKIIEPPKTPFEDRGDALSIIASTNIDEEKEDPKGNLNELNNCRNDNNKQEIQNRVAQWIEQTPQNPVPCIYNRLCQNFFFNGNCVSEVCPHRHIIGPGFRIALLQLPNVQLKEAYDFAKSNSILFNKIYRDFAEIFAKRGHIESLIDIISNIFDNNSAEPNKLEALNKIVENLQNTCQLTFSESVQVVLFKLGLKNFSVLGETVIEMIISFKHLKSYWQIIRVILLTGLVMPLNLAESFLKNLTQNHSADYEFCREIYEFVLKYKCLDLVQVSLNVKEPFLKICNTKNNRSTENGLVHCDNSTIASTVVASGNNIRTQSNIPNTFEENSSNSDVTRCSLRSMIIYNSSIEDLGEVPQIINAECASKRKFPTSSQSSESSLKRFNNGITLETTYDCNEINSPIKQPPEHPSFGYINLDKQFQLDVSLHNLFLTPICNLDIDEADVIVLNDCVKDGSGLQFLELLEKYANPLTVQNFIAMTLADLKGMRGMGRNFRRLLASIERHNPNYFGCTKIRVVLEVITMNLLFALEACGKYEDAEDLLLKFSDWDSLITSRLFINTPKRVLSIVGRYLFIARLLVRTKPELTYEILVCPSLHLLEPLHLWPYHPPAPVSAICDMDLDSRNQVLTTFFKENIHNVVVVIEMFKKALKQDEGIWSFDVKPFIDPLIRMLLTKNLSVQLKQIHTEFDFFYSHMEKSTIRDFLLLRYPYLTKEERFALYEKCVAKHLYQPLIKNHALEHVILISTEMCNTEIELIISYYFQKLTEYRNLPPRNETLKFDISGSVTQSYKESRIFPVINRDQSVIHNYVKKVLREQCLIVANSTSVNLIEVPKGALIRFLENRIL